MKNTFLWRDKTSKRKNNSPIIFMTAHADASAGVSTPIPVPSGFNRSGPVPAGLVACSKPWLQIFSTGQSFSLMRKSLVHSQPRCWAYTSTVFTSSYDLDVKLATLGSVGKKIHSKKIKALKLSTASWSPHVLARYYLLVAIINLKKAFQKLEICKLNVVIVTTSQ